jgi:hypothetical protein
MRVPDVYAGKRVKCPACGQGCPVPGAAASSAVRSNPGYPTAAPPPMPAAAPGKVTFQCSCGQEMMAKTEHGGLKTKCPACEAVVTIPRSRAAGGVGVATQRTQPGGPPPLGGPMSPPPRSRSRRPEDDFDDPDDIDDFDDERPRRGRRKGRKRSMLPWVLIGVAGLLLIGGGTFAMIWIMGGSSADDLALVPGDAQWFAHLRWADMMNTELGRKALAEAKNAPGGDPFAQMREKSGLEPTDIDRITFAANDIQKQEAWAIVTFKKPVDRQKLYSSIDNAKREEATYAGKKYDVLVKGGGGPSDRIAIHWINDKMAVGGPEVGVKRCLDIMGKRPTGAMDEVITRAKDKHSIVFGGVIPPSLSNMAGGPGMGGPGFGPRPGDPLQEGLAALKDTKLVILVIDYDNTTKIELAGRMGSEASAQKAKGSLDGLLAVAKLGLPFAKPQITKGMPPQIGEQVYKTIKSTLEAVQVTQSGSLLSTQVSLDVKGLQDMLAPAMKDLMGGMGPLGGGFGPGPGVGPPDGGPGPGFDPLGGANRARHSNNLKQIALAMHMYADTHGGKLPPAVTYSADGQPLYSWRVELLPYLEQQALYNRFRKNEPWDSPHNKTLLSQMPQCFATPGAVGRQTTTCYQVFVGNNTPWPGDGRTGPRMPATFLDGTSNTILVAEAANPVEWTKPDDMRLLPGLTPKQLLGQRVSPGKYAVAMADGATRWVSTQVSDLTLSNAVNPADGQPLGPDW